MGKKILVLTYSRDHFRHWCHENNVDMKDRRIQYVDDIQSIRGIHDCLVIRWGRFYERNDFEEIEHYLKMIEKEEAAQ